jgi:hypothetical protein
MSGILEHKTVIIRRVKNRASSVEMDVNEMESAKSHLSLHENIRTLSGIFM